jgi:hypothetical protein
MGWSFRAASRRTGLDGFPIVRLSSDYCVSGVAGCPMWRWPWQDADHQGLAPPVGHGLGPTGGLKWPGSCEVGELPDVMDFHLARLLAILADIREEPCHEFLVRVVDPDRLAVGDRRRFCRWSGVSPNRATSGCLPSRPRCLPAKVLSMEVSRTQRSRCSR